jgi:hypothetical protein
MTNNYYCRMCGAKIDKIRVNVDYDNHKIKIKEVFYDYHNQH